ncbi:uncharacterized protein PV09_07294 [Verruconis gallopava]|uniref:Bromo domain-containing protein n=1 Tax=Verruconis gallopava TaxID=253628 RepID=A0A0D1YK47_9PEZI|nr:uncharacterized protein PV09_07294 [Verruconis gallopava]KIW01252.1 hypothetical protein PV09_07294 [Verruconis gallopava]
MSSAFTPLEALLLFQYLSNYGVAPNVFTKISDLLTNDDQIRRSSSYDPARLTPDALRDFYLKLLKDEARSEMSAVDAPAGSAAAGTTNGEASQSGSRKRKAPSPSLPTIQEASRDAHLIPQLIRKLYARYREHAIIQIREDERKYERLRKNISEIKSGAWDERLQREIERGDWDQLLQRKAHRPENGTADASLPESVNGAVKQPAVTAQEKAWKRESDAHLSTTKARPSTPTVSPHPARPLYQQSQPQPPPTSSRSASQSPMHPTSGPIQQAQHAQPQPTLAISPRPPESRASAKPSQSPMLPPPPPAQAGQPYSSYPYANNGHSQQLPSHTPYVPPHGTAAQGQQGSSVAQLQQLGQHPSPHPPSHQGVHGGVMLQPFAVAPQTPTGSRQQSQMPPAASNARPSAASQSQMPQPSAHSGAVLSPFDIAKLLATPLTLKKPQFGPSAPSPSKDTQWKSVGGRAGRPPRRSSPVRPQSRSVSPISERATSPPPEEDAARRSRRGKPAHDNSAQSRNTRIRRARGASTTSSVPGSSVRGRTRSQSVLSHVEDMSMADAASVTGRRVKPEPSTPMESSDFVHPTIEGTPGGGQTTRRGAATGNNKRKRGTREDSDASDVPPALLHPRQDKSVVVANKNFSRLSATIMNDIQSHKHASLFSNPVRDRDAEGYSKIIRRPQDLKSIRAGITAGNRAVNAATASESFASFTASQPHRDAGGIVMLPVSEELVPPKGIVNSAQLEKEVMRMFANAVMFNPGNEDVVLDAREMAQSVEAQITKFREVERSSVAAAGLTFSGMVPPQSGPLSESAATGGGDGFEEQEEMEESSVGKRRKIG